MDLVIKRSEWLRGEGASIENGGSALLRGRDKKKCCLGFLSLACGLTEEEITGVGYPAGALNDKFRVKKRSVSLVPEPLRPLVVVDGLGYFQSSDLLYKITRLNDRHEKTFDNGIIPISEEARESHLQQLFAEHLGVKLTFTD